MENIHNKIKAYLGRTPNFFEEIIIEDQRKDGVSNPYIAKWYATDKAKPTDEQLNALEIQATTLENNNKIDATRRTSYGSWNKQLDEIYHNIDDWKARIKAVKDSNPKESS